MISHCHRLVGSLLLSSLAVAVIGTAPVNAMTLGHSRVVSMPQQPLQIAIQLKELTPDEQDSLRVSIAPIGAWSEAGLVPPVALSTLQVSSQPTTQAGQRRLLLTSSESSANEVLDVLVDVLTSSSTQRFQVSVLQQPSPTPISLAQSMAATESSLSVLSKATESQKLTSAHAETTQIKNTKVTKGTTAWAIAQQNKNQAYTPQQFMMALLQQNPQAFSHNNVNLLRAGASLQLPTLEQVQAIDKQLAQQLFKQHAQWFDSYRQRLAQGRAAPPALDANFSANAHDVALLETEKKTLPQIADSPKPALVDRLHLSTESPAEIKAAQAASIAQELAHTSERLVELNTNNATPHPSTTGTENIPLKIGSAAKSSLETTVSNALTKVDARSSLSDSSADTTSAIELDQTQNMVGWIQNNLIKVLVLLILAVLFIVWVLRRINKSGLRYAEELSPREEKQIEKQKKAQDPKSASDDVEFREIK